jgi:hypothetical protein
MQYSKTLILICLLAISVTFFSTCTNSSFVSNDPRGNAYAGTDGCVSCHQNIVTSYIHTNHYKTSSKINDTALRKILPIDNAFYFQDSGYVRIESNKDHFYQAYYVDGRKTVFNKFDIAFGSGEKAQTYASWQQNKFLQLPLTYFAGMKSWANSPGFSINHANFGRVIESRCFECHSSYIGKEIIQSGPVAVSEKLDKNTVVYGIDCERCHGPAAEHVQFQQENPSVKQAKFIASVKQLSRQQQLDMCAICHSGNDQATQRSLFAFVPGDTLSHFYYPDFESSGREPDVHGKQMQLLQMSLCFKKSNMTCNSCHNSHEVEDNSINNFISKCMNCHQSSLHATTMLKNTMQPNEKTNAVKANCISCHMPLQASKTINFNSNSGDKKMEYLLRTHKIDIYK